MSSKCYLHKHIKIRVLWLKKIYYDHKKLFEEAFLTLKNLQYFYRKHDVFHYVHKKTPEGYYAIYIREVEVIIPPEYIYSVMHFDNSDKPQVGDILKVKEMNKYDTYNKILSYCIYRHHGVIKVEYTCIESYTMDNVVVSHYEEVIALDDYAMLEILKYRQNQKIILDDYARDVMSSLKENQLSSNHKDVIFNTGGERDD